MQNFIGQKVVVYLSKKLKTTVSLKNIRVDFLNHLLIEGLYIEDRQGDTLLYAGTAQVRITDWFFLKHEKPVITYIGLYNAFGHLYRTEKSDEWNYQFVADAFDTGVRDTTKKKNEFELDLEKADIRNTRFHMNDAWAGSDLEIDLGNVQISADEVDLKKKRMDVSSVLIEKSQVKVKDYKGGKPPSPKKERTVDTTAFNPANWLVKIKKLDLKNNTFSLNATERKPYEGEFDPAHIGITGINLTAREIHIAGDTIRGHIAGMQAKERSGLEIKNFRADATVSPVATICKNLFLETNNSKLQDYYAMHYSRFPDFTDYVDKVVMVGNLKNAYVDSRDIAFFAPALKKYPAVVTLAGHVAGTVDSLIGKKLQLSDGNTSLKGDLSVIGLPDIYNSFIHFQNGEIFTTNHGIFKYAPRLRNNPNVAIEKLNYLHYKGDFAGYVENFAANGIFSSNLGDIHSRLKLYIPDLSSKKAVYSGVVSTSGFNIGTLLRVPLIGNISFNAAISGMAFNPQDAAVTMNATVNYLDIKGYRYQKIIVEGKLARKKFDGNLLVDDPNLALAFYGAADFNNREMKINARANLLQSNLQALKLTQDSILAAADFDLDFTGNNIDNFKGFAKLYNINLVRENNRLDVDSVYLKSGFENGQKLLALESNDLSAKVRGDFLLSALPNSIQFYISSYIPNYIIAPTKYAPDQEIYFSVETRNIDSLLAVLAPEIKGFNNAGIQGSVNTGEQQLLLEASAAFGSISGIGLYDINLAGKGDFKKLDLEAKVKNLVVGDSTLTAAVDVRASLGNDSLEFNIGTKSADAIGTLSISGDAFASGDSLYLKLRPSEFYLNQNKWEIPQGNSFVFSKNYLKIKDLTLRSGLQLIEAWTEDEQKSQLLNIRMENLDVAMLGGMAGIAAYQPDGRVQGSVKISHLFNGLTLDGYIHARDVKMGNDTLGNVNLIGNYNAKKKLIKLDPQSGIYYGNHFIRAAGTLSFDSVNYQKLDGYIEFNDAKISWVSPFADALLSQLNGNLNGKIDIGGSTIKPDISGEVIVTDAGAKVDITGTYFKLPFARLNVSSNSIDFGTVNIYDRQNRKAVLSGAIAHNRLTDWRFNRVNLKSPEFEVLDLQDYESSNFYGNLVANVESMNITGTFEDIRMTITASPAARSHIFIPVKTSSDIGSYSYVSFKSYGESQKVVPRSKNKFSLTLVGKMNPLAEMTLVLDPSTGDMINAKGYGVITLEVPSEGNIKMYGNYEIEEGDYTFTLKQLAFRRNFIINSGSKIAFNGDLSATNLNINAIYTTRARLIDLLNEKEKDFIRNTNEEKDAKTAQDINVLLHMAGSLDEPRLSFNIDLPERRAEGSLAYQKLKQINLNDRELFDQVAALLIVNTFIPQEGFVGGTAASTATSGAINNISEMLSTSFSSQLTNIVNKLLGDPDLSIELKYKNYNLSDPLVYGGINRNELSFGIRKNLLNDRLVVEVGSAYDWGRPTSANSSTSNLNLAGDFRLQYLLTEDGRVRLNVFRTNNYDVLVDRNVWRGGVGISYRKTFDDLDEFFNRRSAEKPPAPLVSDSSARIKGSL